LIPPFNIIQHLTAKADNFLGSISERKEHYQGTMRAVLMGSIAQFSSHIDLKKMVASSRYETLFSPLKRSSHRASCILHLAAIEALLSFKTGTNTGSSSIPSIKPPTMLSLQSITAMQMKKRKPGTRSFLPFLSFFLGLLILDS